MADRKNSSRSLLTKSSGRFLAQRALTLFLGLALGACGVAGKQRSSSGYLAVAAEPPPAAPVSLPRATNFNTPFDTLTDAEMERHNRGDQLSNAKYVTAPAPIYGGLGPFYNNNSCTGCHHGDGRGLPILAAGRGSSQLIVKISAANGGTSDEPNGDIPVPGIGPQVQDHAVFGLTPPATAQLDWIDEAFPFPDGTPAMRRRPVLKVVKADGTALGSDVQTSLRLPPAFFGLGLLASVSDEWLQQNQRDSSLPGRVPGRLNEVWSRSLGKTVIGRFGRKANKGTIQDQVGLALAFDIGLENKLFPGPGGRIEVADEVLDSLTFYVETLAYPIARTSSDPAAVHGQALFRAIGCTGCHLETMHTMPSQIVAALSDKEFHPYTDLLLHDMGPDLADHRPDFKATGSEWRTPALWGVGLQATVLPSACYLHDGRARSLTEAILWHGGQALGRREAFRYMRAEDRADLIRFLQSL